jgi:ATP-dependent 26S proteasome regulatory subunit
VIFALTTNRPDILEPALAARPGRIDLTVELPLPDAGGRSQLLELYARGLDLHGVDLTAVAEEIDGATPAYIKELLRKAALLATENGDLTLTREHLTTAITELNEGGRLAQRIAGFRPEQIEAHLSQRPPRPSGFPAAVPMPRNSPSPKKRGEKT